MPTKALASIICIVMNIDRFWCCQT